MRIPEILTHFGPIFMGHVCFKVGHGALQAEVGMIRGRTRERAKDAGKNWRQKRRIIILRAPAPGANVLEMAVSALKECSSAQGPWWGVA